MKDTLDTHFKTQFLITVPIYFYGYQFADSRLDTPVSIQVGQLRQTKTLATRSITTCWKDAKKLLFLIIPL